MLYKTAVGLLYKINIWSYDVDYRSSIQQLWQTPVLTWKYRFAPYRYMYTEIFIFDNKGQMTCEMKVVLLFYDIEMESLTLPTRITMTQIHELHLSHKWVLTTEVICDVCCNLRVYIGCNHWDICVIILYMHLNGCNTQWLTMAFTAGCPTEKPLSVRPTCQITLRLTAGLSRPILKNLGFLVFLKEPKKLGF